MLTPLCRKSAPLRGEHRCSAGSAGQAVTQEHEIESSDLSPHTLLLIVSCYIVISELPHAGYTTRRF